MNPYGVLGVAPDATDKEIRRAYLALARRHHPDNVAAEPPAAASGSVARMAEINQAWTLLRDPATRSAYDLGAAQDASRSSSRDRVVDEEPWRPYDAGFDPPMPAEDIGQPSGMARWLSIAPIGLFIASVFFLIVGAMIGMAPLVGLAFLCFFGAIGGFLVAPLVALAASARADKQ